MIPRTTAGRALYDVLRDRGGLVPILNSIISIEDEAMTLHDHDPETCSNCRAALDAASPSREGAGLEEQNA